MDDHKRYAIVVGVSEYEDTIPPLPYARNDVSQLVSVLQKMPPFSRDRIYTLSNGTNQDDLPSLLPPTRANILHTLGYVCDTAAPDDVILLYFAGHGVEVSQTPYLLVSDTRMNVLHETAVSVITLNKMLEVAKVNCVVRIFDACRSAFGEGRGTVGQMTPGLESAVLKRATGWASFSSCSSGEAARESSEFDQGVFSYYLCQGLTGKAAHDGRITLEGLVEYVKISVGNWCDRQTIKQTPHFQSDISGLLELARTSSHSIVSTTPASSPFAQLCSGIEEHLSRTPDDTRRLSFTSQAEWNEVVSVVHETLKDRLGQLSDPAIAASILDGQPLMNLSTFYDHFRQSMKACGVSREFSKDVMAFKIDFRSQEVVVPTTTLCVAVVRFSFFYWIWYSHLCHQQQLQGMFSPHPQHTKGFFTLKPLAARDNLKVERVLTDLLGRVSEDIITWAQQLGGYVEARVEPLRKAGPVIE